MSGILVEFKWMDFEYEGVFRAWGVVGVKLCRRIYGNACKEFRVIEWWKYKV